MYRALLIAHISTFILAHNMGISEASEQVCQQRYTQPPQVGQRCITDTEIYANKTVERHHCTLICIRDPKCQVINFNAIGSYCLLSQRTCLFWEPDGDFVTITMAINRPCLKWVKNPDNYVYKAIFSDPSATTRVTRIAREENKYQENGKLVGILCTTHGKGLEKYKTKWYAEFLDLSPECTISWVPHNSSAGISLPVGTCIGGHLEDTVLYVARTGAEQSPRYTSGYYDNVNGLGHFPCAGLDQVFNEAEVLVVQGWRFKALQDNIQVKYAIIWYRTSFMKLLPFTC